MKTYFTSLSYLLVLMKKFQKLIDIESNNREKLESIKCDEFTINYQYAAKQLDSKKYNPICLRNITAKTKDPIIRLAAFAVLDQESDVKRILNEQIEASYSNYYLFGKWPIISNKILYDVAKLEAAY